MAQDVPNSAVLVVDVDLALSSSLSAPNIGTGTNADNVINVLQTDMIGDGFTIAKPSVGLSGIFFPLTGTFSARLQILNQSGQDCDSLDIQASFQNACNEEGVELNSFAPLQVITGSGDGTNSGTGAAGNVLSVSGLGTQAKDDTKPGAGVPQCGDPNLTLLKYPSEWISCLTNKALASIGILFIGLILGVIVLVLVQRKT